MKLGIKLLAAPLLTAALVLSAAFLNSVMLGREAAGSQATFRSDLAALRTVDDVKDRLGQVHTRVYRTIALIGSMDDAKVKTFRTELSAQITELSRTLGAVGAAERSDAELRTSVGTAVTELEKYRRQADSAIDLSSVDPNTGIAALQGADETYLALERSAAAMSAQVQAFSTASMAASNARANRFSLVLGLIGLAAAAVALAVSWLMQRRIVRELARAVEVTTAVAGGDLSADATSDRADEVGDLLRALGRMTSQLGASMRTVLDSSEAIRTASVEIAAGNLDLSTRTDQTAGNLQRTAASIEQLTGAVRQSADSARHANQLASSAAEVAARGGHVVAEVVATMTDINVRSRRIADIIGVIDGIAFQTNILALNAAVEAARAGEQGRGFAVVASEVRNLAGRSADAAKEIKALIGASVEKVESGSRLVGAAGETMTEIVRSVQNVSDLIGEISAAANEQSQGIGQVNTAVVQVDAMTQQNAALVEESTAAAESLRTQAARLASVVATFRLGAAGEGLILDQDLPPQPLPTVPSVPSADARVERRGPDRAKNVARLAPSARRAAPAETAPKTGTDDGEWTSF